MVGDSWFSLTKRARAGGGEASGPSGAERGAVGLALAWGSAAHAGLVRAVNQDAILAGPYVFAVADGMGGHAHGEVASSVTVAALAAANVDGGPTPQVVAAAVADANRRVMDAAHERNTPVGDMGTTIAGVAACQGVPDGKFLVFHVGDSRVYRYRNQQLEQLTVDHTVAEDHRGRAMIDGTDINGTGIDETDGNRDLDGALADPQAAHMITRALGMSDDFDMDTSLHEPAIGDRYLICSDGLTNELNHQHLLDVLGRDNAPPACARLLIDTVLDTRARDNVSIVIVDVVGTAPDTTSGTAGGQTQPRSKRGA